MQDMRCRFGIAGLMMLVAGSTAASGQMRITEFQYQGGDTTLLTSEFIEFTNVGASAVNMNGWSYDDDSRVAGTVSLSAFGTVAPGESVMLCEGTSSNCRAAWNLGPAVKIIGGNSANLGRNDEINLFDQGGVLVDRLTFGDQTFPGSPRANGQTAWPCAQAVGTNNILSWRLSRIPDAQNSYLSTSFDTGNPGTFVSFTCPPAATGACCSAGACLLLTAQECTGVGLYQGDGTTCVGTTCPQPSNALVRITEYMHSGAGGEFMEFRNFMGTSVNMTGWSYSDESRVPGQVSLSGFGTIIAGEVVLLSEAVAGDFRTDWGLAGSVKVVGGNTINIGAGDEVNLYDSSGALVDRITFGSVTCSVDADGASVWPCSSAVGTNDILEWRKAEVGDGQGSITSLVGDIGRPGFYTSIACAPGSCCINGSCSIMGRGDCLSAGGLYFGDGTTCASNPCPGVNNSQVRVTEFMYQGGNGEFFELTNMGGSPVNMAGWTFSDSCAPVGAFGLSALGSIAPGQSVIVTDVSPGSFNAAWGLSGVTVMTLPSSELGANDRIRIHDANGAIVDEIQYGDVDFPGSPNTLNKSAWPTGNAIGQDVIGQWAMSFVGDSQSSHASTAGDVGNPGAFVVANIPAASTWGLVVGGLLLPVAGTIIVRKRKLKTA